MEHEVIVVGAGPAGATAAMALAQRGRDVLLLDRQQFPRDKACGDVITIWALQVLYEFGMEEKIRQANFFYPIYGMRAVSPRGYVLDMDLNLTTADYYIASRFDFDALLVQHAIESGAIFKQVQVREPILQDGHVVGVRATVNGKMQEIFARVVIGADGATSTIANALRPQKQEKNHLGIAIRAYIEDLELLPHRIEFYTNKNILPGYAWIFPMNENRANIGVGMRLDKFRQNKRNLNKALSEFMAMPAIRKRLKNGGQIRDVAIWPLTFGSQKHVQRTFNGAILTGDAGAFADPLTGGGIQNGLESALIAAKTVHEALQKGDVSRQTLSIYEQRCHKILTKMKRTDMIQRVLTNFPILIDLTIKLAENNRFIQRLIEKA